MSNELSQASYRIEVDVERVNRLLTALNDKEAKSAIRSGLRKSAAIIRKEAQRNLVAAVPGMKKMRKDVNIAVYRNASGARVDLLDKRRKGSKQFILKFFNDGTNERTTNQQIGLRGGNRGAIKATKFFSNAAISKRGEAEQSLQANIINAIQKAIDKKNK